MNVIYGPVPREPTQAMIDAALHTVMRENGGLEWSITVAWRAMYDAAQREQTEGIVAEPVRRKL